MSEENTMTNSKFLRLWCDKDQERSVVIRGEDKDELTVIINFPPDVVAIGKMQLCIAPILDDPPF